MNTLWTFVLFFTYLTPTFSEPSCNETDDCLCFDEGLEIHCPALSELNDTRFVIHIDPIYQTTHIDCYKMDDFPMNLLPNITLKEKIRLEINDCLLPTNFKKISDHFSMNKIKVLQLEKSNNVILTKDYFNELNLDRIKLNNLNFTQLDQDVFENCSNVYHLEMERNKNLTLSSKIFQNLINLKMLYLANNELEDLPDGIFANLTNLKKLHLWKNQLNVLNENIFANLGNLTSLDIHGNNIENISENAFQNLKKLISVNLSENKIKTISPYIFKNNDHLQMIGLQHNPIQIPDFLLANLKSLEVVFLWSCSLNTLPEHLFENSKNLKTLKLQNNNLTTISPIFFQGLVNLEILELQNNFITEIGDEIFKNLRNLKEINLHNNLINRISYRAFYNKRNLSIMDFSYNKYSGGENLNILEDANNVEKLDFSHNFLKKIEDILSPHSMLNLKDLDLSYNNLTTILLTELQSSSVNQHLKVKLHHNNITTISFENVDNVGGFGKTFIDLGYNRIECSCNNYELLQFINEEKYPKNSMFEFLTEELFCDGNLEGRKFTDLASKELTCEVEATGCPSECFCHWRPYDASMVIDCSYKNLSVFPIITEKFINTEFNQTELHLEGNRLESGPSENLRYDNVTNLYLSYNKIKNLEWIPPKIKNLYIDNNRLGFLSDDVLAFLNKSHLRNLTLYGNEWACDCTNVKLTNFLREHSSKMNFNNVFCRNSTKHLLNLSEADLCHTNLIFYILLPVLTFFLLFSILLVLFYRYQEEIKVWLFAHDMLLWWVTEEELDRNKTYDAFISYSHKDEDFLLKEIIPVLESGQNPYKLCLHFRNFIPGEFISTQITKSVEESRRTLVVLSPSFLESVWGKMEFRTAHAQAMTDGRTRVIIVLFGEIEIEKLDDELKAYLKTNTYVKWGDKYFWDKLKYAMPHVQRKHTKHEQKLANVMNCIDDKFGIVKEVKDNPDGDVLKKHLDLVPRMEVNTPPAEAPLIITCN